MGLPVKKEYLVTFFGDEQRYRNTIQDFDKSHAGTQLYGRTYKDESEMIEIVNPFLPNGGDLRHTMHLVKRQEGLQKFLYLTPSDAESLGYGQPV